MMHFRRWGAVYILALLFLAAWAGQFAAQLVQVTNDAAEHGQPFQWSEFWPQFWSSTLENHQSEFLQLAVQALLVVGFARALFFKSVEDMDHIERQLARIERKIDEG